MRARRFIVTIILVAFALLVCGHKASAKIGSFHVAIIQVQYSDTKSLPVTQAQLKQAARGLHDWYRLLSYGKLDLRVSVTLAKLPAPASFYETECTVNSCWAVPAATYAHIQTGFSFADVDGVFVLRPEVGVWDVTVPPVDLRFTGGKPVTQLAVGVTSPAPPYPAIDSSGVWWGPIAHETGHELQLDDAGDAGHPSGYASGYDLMDSCYPCNDSAFALSGETNVFKLGHDWLDSDKILTLQTPFTDKPHTDVYLAPLEEQPGENSARGTTFTRQAVKIYLDNTLQRYYVVDLRERYRTDVVQDGHGIYDEGIEILRADETSNPPVTVCLDKSRTGCWQGFPPPATPLPKPLGSESSTPKPAPLPTPACRGAWAIEPTAFGGDPCQWPVSLWHVGEKFIDHDAGVEIDIVKAYKNAAGRTNGYKLTINPSRPEYKPRIYITPWFTPPLYTKESPDVWIDSSCNGYEDAVGAIGLLYGRRADGSVIGNGDPVCVGHENRIYALVRNEGDAAAYNVKVSFEVTNPFGIGISEENGWTHVGDAVIGKLNGNSTATTYVAWTPPATFGYPSGVRVTLYPGPDDADYLGRHEAYELLDVPEMHVGAAAASSIDRILTVADPGKLSGTIVGRTVMLAVRSNLPAGSTYRLGAGNGVNGFAMPPGGKTTLPIHVSLGNRAVAGRMYLFGVTAYRIVRHVNHLAPATSVYRYHNGIEPIASTQLMLRAVAPSSLSLTAELQRCVTQCRRNIVAEGALAPVHAGAYVTIDFIDPLGRTTSRTSSTNNAGAYIARQLEPAPGLWHIRTQWLGDKDHASAVSKTVAVVVSANFPQIPTPSPAPLRTLPPRQPVPQPLGTQPMQMQTANPPPTPTPTPTPSQIK